MTRTENDLQVAELPSPTSEEETADFEPEGPATESDAPAANPLGEATELADDAGAYVATSATEIVSEIEAPETDAPERPAGENGNDLDAAGDLDPGEIHAAVAAEPGDEASSAVPAPPHPLDEAMQVLQSLRNRVSQQVLGRDEVIDLVLVALLSDGHVLLEDFPGSGKTTLAKALGASILAGGEEEEIADFRRIQFTPDLLPSDVTGVSVFDPTSGQFHYRRGPIFAHVVLADEINRTSPKVQAAMLEAMAEKQVTVDNVTYALDELFFVIATQNPLDLAGTYPLPVAQLDRFLFKIRMEHIDRESELQVLDTYLERRDVERPDLPKVSRNQVLAARRALEEHVAIDRQIKISLVDIANNLRGDERVLQGNSTRSLVLMLPALQARAALSGRDYVNSNDIRALIPRVLGHRLELAPGLHDSGDVLEECMKEPLETLARSTLRRRT